MKCANCELDAAFIDDRPGADTVGFCHAHLPHELLPLADQLVVKPAPKPVEEEGPQPTEAGTPTPIAQARDAVAEDGDAPHAASRRKGRKT